MAASGLDPGRRYSGIEGRRARRNAIMSLLNFAVDIRKHIKRNDREFQNPKLRIGIAHGPVTAGVVGSKKPLYDIWGDPVNMASRMESTGREDHIQVMQETAHVIQEHGFSCTFRGHTFVKGRSTEVPTYFVDIDEDDNLIRTSWTVRNGESFCVDLDAWCNFFFFEERKRAAVRKEDSNVCALLVRIPKMTLFIWSIYRKQDREIPIFWQLVDVDVSYKILTEMADVPDQN